MMLLIHCYTYACFDWKVVVFQQTIARVYFILDKIGKLQIYELYLPKCLCLEYVQYKNYPKECRQGINFAIN